MVKIFKQVFNTPYSFIFLHHDFYITVRKNNIIFHKIIDAIAGLELIKLRLEKTKELISILVEGW